VGKHVVELAVGVLVVGAFFVSMADDDLATEAASCRPAADMRTARADRSAVNSMSAAGRQEAASVRLEEERKRG
jgi:hypothetical protein